MKHVTVKLVLLTWHLVEIDLRVGWREGGDQVMSMGV